MSPGRSDRSRLKQIGCAAALVLIGLAVFVPRTVASAGIPEGVWLIDNEAAVQIFDCTRAEHKTGMSLPPRRTSRPETRAR